MFMIGLRGFAVSRAMLAAGVMAIAFKRKSAFFFWALNASFRTIEDGSGVPGVNGAGVQNEGSECRTS